MGGRLDVLLNALRPVRFLILIIKMHLDVGMAIFNGKIYLESSQWCVIFKNRPIYCIIKSRLKAGSQL